MAAAARRAPGQRLPGRRGHRLGYRCTTTVAEQQRASALRERRRDYRRAVRHRLDVRTALGRPLQSSLSLHRRRLRRSLLTRRTLLPAGPGGGLPRRGGRRQRHIYRSDIGVGVFIAAQRVGAGVTVLMDKPVVLFLCADNAGRNLAARVLGSLRSMNPDQARDLRVLERKRGGAAIRGSTRRATRTSTPACPTPPSRSAGRHCGWLTGRASLALRVDTGHSGTRCSVGNRTRAAPGAGNGKGGDLW